MNREQVEEFVGSLPGWARSRYALTIPVLLVVVPVLVSLLRASHFETRLEVFPTMPPGNAGLSADYLRVRALVVNPGFDVNAKGWRGAAGCALRRSTRQPHSGAGSLGCVRERSTAADGTALSTDVVLPAPGRYRVEAWVRLPRGYAGGPPTVELDGFSASRRVGGRVGDRRVRGSWQPVWSEYAVEGKDMEGSIVLRHDRPLPPRGQVLYWDDVRALSANDVSLPAPPRVNLVSNSGFESDRSSWGDPPTMIARRSASLAHSGSASMRSSSADRAATDTNAGYTYVVFPRGGTYRAQGWVYIPRRARPSHPVVFLEGFSGSTQVAQRLADPARRGTWQRVSTDYAISSHDLEGALVLRVPPESTGQGAGGGAPGLVAYWDDVGVPAPRSKAPRDALEAANSVRAALAEPQLRFEVSLMARDKRLYDPRRATVVRSPRRDALSFIVTVASDVPGDARRLSAPLRAALLRAARRSTLRQAQATWQNLISRLERTLPARKRELLQRRANVLQRVIGAQAADVVALPSPGAEASAPVRSRQAQVTRNRQKVIARLGSDLAPRQRALVEQRAEDLQRMIGAQVGEYLVTPSGPVPQPTRAVDRLLDGLPGSFPPRVGAGWAGAAGLVCGLLLFGMLVALTAVRQRSAAPGR